MSWIIFESICIIVCPFVPFLMTIISPLRAERRDTKYQFHSH
jgi:hypothetical protein